MFLPNPIRVVIAFAYCPARFQIAGYRDRIGSLAFDPATVSRPVLIDHGGIPGNAEAETHVRLGRGNAALELRWRCEISAFRCITIQCATHAFPPLVRCRRYLD
jgi:hypothetical protein